MKAEILELVKLKEFNTFGIDILARYFTKITKVDDIKAIENWELYKHVDKLVLGGGSNILFTQNFAGLIIKNELKGIEVIFENEEHVNVKVMAGENWHEFVLHSIQNNWGGIENLSLIPGCVGAAPIQNIGAYGVELADVLDSVDYYNIEEKRFETISAQDCHFGYRDSIFKKELKSKTIILSIVLELTKKPVIDISYGAIKRTLDELGFKKPGIKEVSDAVISIRSSKLPDPEKIGNAGSFFKNPIVQKDQFQAIQLHFEDVPSYPVGENQVKIPAAWLIEQAGWKGYRSGDIGTYPSQPLVLVNFDRAKGSEINDLSDRIKSDVKIKFGIDLQKEVNII